MSTIHPQIFYDAQSLVNALAPSQERLRARHELHERLRELIRSYAGQDFDVDDISMLNYAEDLDIAPLDLMIIDKRHPTGLPPGTDPSNLPDVYYPSRIASFLQDCGLDGVIQSTEVQRRDGITGGWKRGDPPPQPDTDVFRWPRYKRTPKTEIVYPAILEGTTPEPFRLSLPGPTIRHEMNLFHPDLRLDEILGRKRDEPKDPVPSLNQEEEVFRLAKAGYSTTVSAEQSYPPSDFSPFLLQFLRYEGLAPGNLSLSGLTKSAEADNIFQDPRMRDELMRLYHTTVPGQMIREKRQRTLAKITSTIQSNFGSEYRIQVFGSTQYGVDGKNSDLDLVVIDFAPDVDLNSLPRIYKISAVSTVLWKSGFQILQKVPNATVPIVKFKDPSTDIQCDLNINDQLGSVNTSLIQQYCDILPVLRPLLLAIKRWARPLGYNSPAGAPWGANYVQ
ncbi:hypothetical protein EDB83DRAFT_2521347 [Lactarius deliciosus]|nr:hypothetical protein EDB83DRAFT_2521347 [Lactarius deliciosus]